MDSGLTTWGGGQEVSGLTTWGGGGRGQRVNDVGGKWTAD